MEGAWASRYPAKVSRHLQLRLETYPKAIQDLSWKAQGRLCNRFRRLLARGNHSNRMVVAVARELVGFMWAIAKQVTVTPESPLTKGWHPALRRLATERVPTCMGSDAAPVWCNPRWREETSGILVPRVRQAPDGHK